MTIGIPEVLLLFGLMVYIYMLVDRICKCAEQCSLNKSMSNVYSKVDFSSLNDLIKSTKSKET